MVLSRTNLIARELFMVGMPTASAACRIDRPGPSDTVFRTYASQHCPVRSHNEVTVLDGSNTSTVWPHLSSWRAFTSGMESRLYCSSTMKQKCILRLLRPAGARIVVQLGLATTWRPWRRGDGQ